MEDRELSELRAQHSAMQLLIDELEGRYDGALKVHAQLKEKHGAFGVRLEAVERRLARKEGE